MEPDHYTVGAIFQIDPKKVPELGAQFVVATEIKEWGIQGYLLLDRPDTGALVRYKDHAFVRRKWDEIVHVGHTEWMWKSREDE